MTGYRMMRLATAAALVAAVMASCWAVRSTAQSFDSENFATGSFSDESFWFSGEAPDPVYVFNSGTAFDANGRMRTVFLADAEAVPATAVFVAGLAHAQDGSRYVAEWPTDDAVAYVRGVAIRQDGAMVVTTSGSAVASVRGLRFTARGEVLVTESNPSFFVAGLGIDGDGNLSVTNSD